MKFPCIVAEISHAGHKFRIVETELKSGGGITFPRKIEVFDGTDAMGVERWRGLGSDEIEEALDVLKNAWPGVSLGDGAVKEFESHQKNEGTKAALEYFFKACGIKVAP